MYQKKKKLIETKIDLCFDRPNFSQIVLTKTHVEVTGRGASLIRITVLDQNNKVDRYYFGYFVQFCLCHFSFSKKTPVFTNYFRIKLPPIGIIEIICYIRRIKGINYQNTYFKVFKNGKLALKGIAHNNNNNPFKKTIYDIYCEGKHFNSLNNNFPEVVYGGYTPMYLLLDCDEFSNSTSGESIFFIRLSHYILNGTIETMHGV